MCRQGMGFFPMTQKRKKHKWSYGLLGEMSNVACGVYAFWCRSNGRCIYVGQAKDQPIKNRLHDHWNRSHNQTLRWWIQSFGKQLDVCFVCRNPKKIDCLERRLIKLWKPEANEQHNPQRRRA